MTDVERAWLAGLLEGEGSFPSKHPNRIRMAMTDRDVVERAAHVSQMGTVRGPYKQTGFGTKEMWYWNIKCSETLALCDVVYPLMGNRRRAQIDTLRASYLSANCQ